MPLVDLLPLGLLGQNNNPVTVVIDDVDMSAMSTYHEANGSYVEATQMIQATFAAAMPSSSEVKAGDVSNIDISPTSFDNYLSITKPSSIDIYSFSLLNSSGEEVYYTSVGSSPFSVTIPSVEVGSYTLYISSSAGDLNVSVDKVE